MKCRIYLFANDLIYDDVVSEQRHLGLENLIGAIFIPSEEYEFGFGFFPRLTYNLQKSAYTDKWDKLKQFLSTAKKDKENIGLLHFEKANLEVSILHSVNSK